MGWAFQDGKNFGCILSQEQSTLTSCSHKIVFYNTQHGENVNYHFINFVNLLCFHLNAQIRIPAFRCKDCP